MYTGEEVDNGKKRLLLPNGPMKQREKNNYYRRLQKSKFSQLNVHSDASIWFGKQKHLMNMYRNTRGH